PGKDTANVAAEQHDPLSLLTWYRLLIHVRHASAALRTGALRLLSPADRSTPVLAFVRETPGERILVVHNLGTADADAGPYVLPGETAEPLLTPAGENAPAHAADGWTVRLPAGASGVWRLR